MMSQSKARFNVGCWGRQTGKTTYGLDKMIWKPMAGRPGGVYWYILQTHQAAEVAFNRYLMSTMNVERLFLDKNESEKWVMLDGGRQIFFKSGQNFQDLRIETLDGAIIDEYRQQDPRLWRQIIRPMLARRNGWCDFLSTPNGYEHFYDLWQEASKNESGEWAAFNSPCTEAWWWTPEEIASAKATMSENEFAQEILAEFRDLMAGKVYLNHGAHNWLPHTPFPSSDPDRQVSDKLSIVLGCDFNLSPMCWTLGQFDRTKWYWFDEIRLTSSHTQEASKCLMQKLLLLKSKNLLRAQPNIIICGDATGKAGQRAATGQSDYDILFGALKANGISYENATPEANPLIADRVNSLNTALRAADGSTSFFYNPDRCKWLKHDFDRVVWKGDGILDSGTEKILTHPTDSVGYPVTKLSPIKSAYSVGHLRVIYR